MTSRWQSKPKTAVGRAEALRIEVYANVTYDSLLGDSFGAVNNPELNETIKSYIQE